MKSEREIELENGCSNESGEDFCGQFIYHKDKTVEDILCVKCRAELKGIREERKIWEKKVKKEIDEQWKWYNKSKDEHFKDKVHDRIMILEKLIGG